MNPRIEWIDGFAGTWCSYVLQSTVQAAIVGVLLYSVVRWVGRRWPAPLRYALLILALLKFACPPLLPFPSGLFTRFSLPVFNFLATSERKPKEATESADGTVGPGSKAGGLASFARVHSRTGAAFSILSAGWTTWLMAIHAGGAVGLALLVTKRTLSLRRLAGQAEHRLGGTLGEEYRNLAIELGVFPIPPVAISDAVQAPMAFGVRKAVILLPATLLERLSPAELRTVLAHELTHCRRGDLWVNGVQLVLLGLWWFHPVLWLVNRGLREVREDCCDDFLLARGLVRSDEYCDVLFRTATELAPPLEVAATLGFGGRVHPLERRIVRIMDWSIGRCEQVSTRQAMAVLTAAALLLPGARERQTSRAEAPMPVLKTGQLSYGSVATNRIGPTARRQDYVNRPKPGALAAGRIWGGSRVMGSLAQPVQSGGGNQKPQRSVTPAMTFGPTIPLTNRVVANSAAAIYVRPPTPGVLTGPAFYPNGPGVAMPSLRAGYWLRGSMSGRPRVNAMPSIATVRPVPRPILNARGRSVWGPAAVSVQRVASGRSIYAVLPMQTFESVGRIAERVPQSGKSGPGI